MRLACTGSKLCHRNNFLGTCLTDTPQDAMSTRARGDYASAFTMFNQLANVGMLRPSPRRSLIALTG